MTTRRTGLGFLALAVLLSAVLVTSFSLTDSGREGTAFAYTVASPDDVPGGELRVIDDVGEVRAFPLKHTDVEAEVVGNVARVEVTQHFENPYDQKIEAVYVFPLPNRAAVDRMEIRIGERTIKGVIKKREEARRIYENARRAGHVAALLDQERPNIFTQSVANILPGNGVEVTIRYFEALPYVEGQYTFSFPMVVGPRFIPGQPTSPGDGGWSPNTTDVSDASRITPPVLKPRMRSGHDISLRLRLDAGAELTGLDSPSHEVGIERPSDARATIELSEKDSIPNKDFVLRYRLDGDAPRVVMLPHRTEEDGYFLMLVQPEARPAPETIAPKEMVFVVDGSGSMSGFPIEKVKEAMRYALENLNDGDTFQIIRFSNRAESFRPAPVPATPANVARGLAYVENLSGRGGTIMLEGVQAALDPPKDPERLRIVSFMTDGYIGNENQILSYLDEHLGGARLFSFGVGSSVNRYLLDKMAELGRGAVEYVLLNDDAEAPVTRFYDRIRNPYLTDLDIDWRGLEVEDVYPERLPDLFLGQPVVVHGRYTTPGKKTIVLTGRLGGEPYEQRVDVRLPRRHEEGEAIGTLWARARIEDLSNRQIVEARPETVEAITRVALKHHLVSAYTSFVAVEERITTGTDEPVRVEVPVEMPAGVSYEGVFGEADEEPVAFRRSMAQSLPGRLAPGVVAPSPKPLPTAPGELSSFEAGSLADREVRETKGRDAVSVHIAASRKTYRLGEPIELLVTIENQTGRPVRVPGSLSVNDGTARFQILDTRWKTLAHPPTSPGSTTTVELAPGDSTTLRVVVNGPGGYRFEAPGTYHLVLLGGGIGLPDSNRISLRIEP